MLYVRSDLKVIILGAASVGKTCLLQRYLTGEFAETISVSIYIYMLCMRVIRYVHMYKYMCVYISLVSLLMKEKRVIFF